jgi:hypothetical protein
MLLINHSEKKYIRFSVPTGSVTFFESVGYRLKTLVFHSQMGMAATTLVRHSGSRDTWVCEATYHLEKFSIGSPCQLLDFRKESSVPIGKLSSFCGVFLLSQI